MADILQDLKFKDYDKYLACLFADKEQQLDVAAIFLFHFEIYNIPQTISEPMVAKIKLQWWRDVLQEIDENKPARPHPVLQQIKDYPHIFPALREILDGYESLVDGFQPKNFDELTKFLKQTICKSFKAANIITETKYNEDLALAYSYQFIARKLTLNSTFAQSTDVIPEKLISDAKKLLPENKSAFQIIASHYINLFEKHDHKPNAKKLRNTEWKLALKLFVKNPSLF